MCIRDSVTTPNGTHLGGETKVDVTQFKAARNTMNVTMGDTWARGDLKTVNLHFATTANGVGANLVFQSAAPPTRFGCLLYTSDAADERSSVDLGGRRII